MVSRPPYLLSSSLCGHVDVLHKRLASLTVLSVIIRESLTANILSKKMREALSHHFSSKHILVTRYTQMERKQRKLCRVQKTVK